MKIGILTFHRAINYGAVLQAYALQEVLLGYGHEVYIIDYRQPRVERTDRHPFLPDDKKRLLIGLHLRSWWQYDDGKRRTLLRRERFDDFLNKYLNLTAPCSQNDIPEMDAYVIGSDQVWNSAICDGVDPVFWGDFVRPIKSKLISYAASTSVKDLEKQDVELLQKLLKGFDRVSLREESTSSYINNNFSLNALSETVLDPTLLAESTIWSSFDDGKYKDSKYVLYFGARSCSDYPTVLADKAKTLASEMKCDVMNIKFNSDTPVDFVNKFRYASAVVTSSFHGVAFSLIFNRPLYAVQYGDEQDARYVNVLQSIGAENMLINKYQEVFAGEFDYMPINEKMEEIRQKSIEYLKCL